MTDSADQIDFEPEPISEEMDALACVLIDYSLDLLGEVGELAPTLAVEDDRGASTRFTTALKRPLRAKASLRASRVVPYGTPSPTMGPSRTPTPRATLSQP